MKLIVGLGNPGPEHEKDRHNVGFLVLDRLARRHAAGAVARSRFHGVVLEATIEQHRALLLRPTTFMNRSGTSVGEAVRFHKFVPQADLLVVVDDIALPCGTIRLRVGGGTGGHNGLSDIHEKLATDEYARLRIGIDAPGAIPQAQYVLGRFRPDQAERLEPALEESVAAVECWLTRGPAEAMNRFNRRSATEDTERPRGTAALCNGQSPDHPASGKGHHG